MLTCLGCSDGTSSGAHAGPICAVHTEVVIGLKKKEDQDDMTKVSDVQKLGSSFYLCISVDINCFRACLAALQLNKYNKPFLR